MTHHTPGNQSGAMSGTHAGSSAGPRNWPDYSTRYQADWQARYPDKPWQEHEHAYRYGWEYGSNPQFAGRDFDTMNQDMERDWPNRHSRWGSDVVGRIERGWHDVKETVREGFSRARQEIDRAF